MLIPRRSDNNNNNNSIHLDGLAAKHPVSVMWFYDADAGGRGVLDSEVVLLLAR